MNADSIQVQVEKILASGRFANSERHSRLLQYLLAETLAGHGGQLKEYVLGVEVFDRGESFDPQTDAIVRTELSRLRAKLAGYYENEGRDDDLIIGLPKRSYSLAFRLKGAGPANEAPAEAPQRLRNWAWTGAALVAGAVLISYGSYALGRTSASASEQAGAAGDLTSIAVLPFASFASDPEVERFADGLTEELIHCLAEIDGLRVVSRTSVFQFKGKRESLRAIAGILHVGLVLEGAVHRSGNRLRITTRLVNAAEGYQLYSYDYERESQNLPAVQAEIAGHVANALPVHKNGERRVARFTEKAEAYRLYLQGLYHANRHNESDLRQAIHSYEGAIASDRDYAPAHASLADAYILLALLNEASPGQAMQRAEQAARTAVKTGDTLSHSHSALGSVLALYHRDWPAAEKEFHKALELDPNDSGIRLQYAMRYLLPRGSLDAALFELQLAQQFDPFSAEIVLNIGRVQCFRREPGRSVETLQRLLHLEPHSESAPLALGVAYAQKSLMDAARNTLQDASAPTEDEARLAVLGQVLALSGHPVRARQILEQLKGVAQQQYVSGYYFALLHLALGERGEALNWLEKAAAEHCPLIVYSKVDPRLDPLRGEPRFHALLKKVGLS